MKNERKYLSVLLISMLFICVMQMSVTYAASSPSLSASADAVSVTEGGYVNISVNLSGNPSISTLGVALSYDSSVLKYSSAAWSNGFSENDMKMSSDTGSEVNLSVVCDNSYSADGTVVTVRFQAVQDSSSIPVTLELRDMADTDLSAVSDCKVIGSVRVPETAIKKEDTAESKVPETTLDGNKAENENKPSEQRMNSVANTDIDGVKSSVNAVTSETQGMTSRDLQSTSSQNVKSELTLNTGNAKADQNYQTGAGLGNDIFLIIAVVCGILALILAVGKHKGERQ